MIFFYDMTGKDFQPHCNSLPIYYICLILSSTYHAKNYASIISRGLTFSYIKQGGTMRDRENKLEMYLS